MDILCSRCGTPIQAIDVNIANCLAKCRACNAIFNFSAQINSSAPPSHLLSVPLPNGLRISEDAHADTNLVGYRQSAKQSVRLVITWSWYSTRHYFSLILCVAWDSFLIVWYRFALQSTGIVRWVLATFPLVHLAIGIWLSYRTIAGLLNKTTISVTPESIKIWHAPIPWPGRRAIASANVYQVYCKEMVSQGKGGSVTTYDLSAVLKDGREVSLLSGLPAADQAVVIAQMIHEHLGIRRLVE